MKIFMIVFINLAVSLNIQANEYCADRSLYVIDQFKTQMMNCSANVNVSSIAKLASTINSGKIGYSHRVSKKLRRVYSDLYYRIPYLNPQNLTESELKCIKDLTIQNFERVKVASLDAMVICGF